MPRPKSSVFAFSALSFFLIFALGLAAPNLAYAKLALTPKNLAFGNVVVGTTSPAQTEMATNTSGSAITFTSIVASPPFLKVGDTCDGSLGGGVTCHIDVECMPTTSGLFNGTLTFNLSHGKPATVALTCTGVGGTPTPTATAATATPTTTAATATPTPTPTGVTPTPTPSPSPSGGTPTPTTTAATATPTPTPSPSPGGTPTPTPTGGTPTSTPTLRATPTPTTTPKPAFSGKVMSGGNPVSGSGVKVLAAGSTGYGTGATQISTTTSAADGTFNSGIFVCPSDTTQIYVTAQGGNAGGGTNSSLMMIAPVGSCDMIGFSARTFVVNEVTTADSAYALAQFLSTSSAGTVGAPSTNATGLINAFATAANLVDPTTGTALSTTPGGAGTVPQQNLNSIANALGACVQTNGASSAGCTELFDCALPGAVFSAGACSGGTGSVADTLAAALSIALHPATVSVAGVNDAATKAALYSPSLASVPNDWSMPLSFNPTGSNFSSLYGVAIDSSSHVWLTSKGGNTVTALNNNGTLFGNFAPAGSNFDSPQAVAIDGSDHVWVANALGNTVTALNNDGTLSGNFAPAGSNFSEPSGVAIDGSGRLWVTNTTGNTVTALNNAGTLFGNFAPSGSNFTGPNDVAIDSSGNVWTPNFSGNTLTALNNAGALFGNFAPSGSNFNMPFDVKVDSSGHVWVTNNGGNTVTALNNGGTLFGNFAPTGSNFSAPQGVAIDSSGRVWVVNVGGNTVTALNNTGTLFGNFAAPGSNFSMPFRVAIDSSGNVWVTNATVNAVSELVGVAAPVKTPFIGPPQLP